MLSARLRRQRRPHIRLNSLGERLYEEEDLPTEAPSSRTTTSTQQRNHIAGRDNFKIKV